MIATAPSHFYLSPAEQAARDASVAAHLHRQRRLQAAYDNADGSHLRVVFDLSYPQPTRQAASSMVTQLRVVAHHNRTAEQPACLHLSALDPRILAADAVAPQQPGPHSNERREGEEGSEAAAVAAQFVRDLRERWSDGWLMRRSAAPVIDSFDHASLVYLSPDAQHILWRVTPRLVYVVGGLIDKRAVVANVSRRAAEALRVKCARLPIRECVPHGLRKSALNVDTVFALLLHVHQAAERIRHTRQQPDNTTPPSSSPPSSASAAPDEATSLTRYGCQLYSRRRARVPREYKLPLFNAPDVDEGIDWYRLWCEAFDAVIPPRLRWSDSQTQ